MGRVCAECETWCSSSDFSGNQWRKGDGSSRCKDCVSGCGRQTYCCGQCYRVFRNQNELNMHMQVHRPRSISCPVCGDKRFRSVANATQHVESGYCTGCLGKDNARRAIYKFASSKSEMRPYMTHRPLLTNGAGSEVPDFPYNCPDCGKCFRHLSQLLQHQDQKHSNVRMLTY